MSIPVYVDEYRKMKNPEAYARCQEVIANAVNTALADRGVITSEQRAAFIDETTALWAEARAEAAEKADKAILDLYGFTVADLDKMRDDKARKQAGGRTAKPAASLRPQAFQYLHRK